MPLDTFARNLAVSLTGREHWPAASGPEAFAGRDPVELLCDLSFRGQEMLHKPLVIVENVPFKQRVGLNTQQRFFSPIQLGGCKGIEDLLIAYNTAKQADSSAQPTKDQRHALDVQAALERIAVIIEGEPLAIVSGGPGKTYLHAGAKKSDAGAEKVGAAWTALGKAYVAGSGIDAAVNELFRATQAAGVPDPVGSRAVELELIYNRSQPWLVTACAYALALVCFGISTVAMRRVFLIAGIAATVAGIAAHIGGIGLRIAILGRAPVSNTYEALLWMGLVALAVGLAAQLMNRKAWYFVAGIGVAELSVLFANLVPLESQTGSIPAVLRSNYWLIVHVLTITASYGVLAVASILSHIYLVKDVLFARKGVAADGPNRFAHPLIAQTYRAMQLGLVLLTAGTILGGVWAADSWGRFWGWDPKETWALISIVVYFIILHARYLHWLEDFGTAVCGVLAFSSIVWTFYGVNYLMAAGLHSYGFGNGGGTWVGAWALAEILFVGVCWLRLRSLQSTRGAVASSGAGSASGVVQGA